MIYSPIWKDQIYTGSTTLNYEITYNGATIFAGKAYPIPSTGRIEINVSKICANYLSQNIDTLFNGASSESNPNAIGTFYLKSNGVTLETYTYLYCWDYETNWTGQTITLSNPICDVYGSGMMVPTTICNGSTVSTGKSSPSNTDDCVIYGIYYLNRKGGWDAFAIRGNVIKKDNISSYFTDKVFDNRTREFEKSRYLQEIKEQYEMHTHMMNDEESENFAKNVISSPKLYVHNLTDGTIQPANIIDNSVSYQTYKNNGKKLCSYKFTVELSQTRLRQ